MRVCMQISEWRAEIRQLTSPLVRKHLQEALKSIYAEAATDFNEQWARDSCGCSLASQPEPTAQAEGLSMDKILQQDWWPVGLQATKVRH